MNDPEAIRSVLDTIEERKLAQVQIGIFDVNGRLRSKRHHPRVVAKALDEGTALPIAVFGVDPAERLIDTSRFIDPADQFRDAVVLADAASCRDFPLDAGGKGLLLLAQLGGDDAVFCPRAQLASELARLAELGFELYGGLELECCVLDESRESIRTRTADTVRLRRGYDRVYSFVDQTADTAFLDEITDVCTAMGIRLDTLHTEFIGMLEAGLGPEVGMRVADNAALYKSVLKAIGLRHELMVSFMARRHPAEQGCGAHINVSLRDASSGEGVFFDEAEPDCISRTMRHFIGGLHAHVPELFLLFAPHLNSYKRFFPELFTPLNNTWGVNNKTVAFRAINLSRNSARIEVRVSGADLSPHLALAAVVAAGRRGIEEAIEPPPPVVGDGWSVSDAPGPGFPLRFPDAIDRFEASALARELMGDDFVDQFASDRRWQLDEFERAVTDWELKMYAEGV